MPEDKHRGFIFYEKTQKWERGECAILIPVGDYYPSGGIYGGRPFLSLWREHPVSLDVGLDEAIDRLEKGFWGKADEVWAPGYCNPCSAVREVRITRVKPATRPPEDRGRNEGYGSCPICGKEVFTFLTDEAFAKLSGTVPQVETTQQNATEPAKKPY